MSAEIIIMNKDGLALAADSAVTFSASGAVRKIFNTSEKLFALSKYHPVGILHYGRTDFMGIKWNTIIQSYRDALGEKAFDKLSDYENDFLHYLAAFPYFSESQMLEYLDTVCHAVCSRALSRIMDDLCSEFNNAEDIPAEKIENAITVSLRGIKERLSEKETDKHIKLDADFIDSHAEAVHKTFKMMFEAHSLSDEQCNELTAILKLNFQKKGYIDNYAGIVIAGFGEREIFPSVCEFKASGKLGNNLIYFDRKTTQAEAYSSFILPFAQEDVVTQFVYGVDLGLVDHIIERVSTLLSSVAPSLDKADSEKKQALLDLLTEHTYEIIHSVNKSPILDIVRHMDIQEMVLMAEALINLTSLKRRVSDEAETVGGPVDVAQITKSEGFIWVKRKTRYDPHLNAELNQNYFRRSKYGNL